MTQRKPTLCLDFDGVLHSYTSPWQGAHHVPDPPTPGAMEALLGYLPHFKVMIFSSRSAQFGGIEAMRGWLIRHLVEYCVETGNYPKGVRLDDWVFTEVLPQISFPTEKPPAHLTIDDRGFCFQGEWPAVEWIKGFRPWNKD